MSMLWTLVALAAALAVLVASFWHAHWVRTTGRIGWLPYAMVDIVAGLVVVIMLAHLISLLTGTPLRGRFGY